MKKPAGSLLLKQGEPPECISFVKSGTVLFSAMSAVGDETLCAVRGENSLLGLELLRDRPSECEAWALTDVVLCRLDARSFRGWLGDRNNPMGAILELALDEALRRRDERVALSGTACARVARFLLERLRIEGRVTALSLEQQVLARMLGMRAETLSRAVGQLRECGALAAGRGIRIIDVQRLAVAAGEDEA